MKSLKLNKLNINNLSRGQMRTVIGGEGLKPTCSCGCCYVNQGGPNTGDNLAANYAGHFFTRCADGVIHVFY
jgi:natural product precursor